MIIVKTTGKIFVLKINTKLTVPVILIFNGGVPAVTKGRQLSFLQQLPNS